MFRRRRAKRPRKFPMEEIAAMRKKPGGLKFLLALRKAIAAQQEDSEFPTSLSAGVSDGPTGPGCYPLGKGLLVVMMLKHF